jgi:isochorismate synthase / 2-succinyl-5-enolpyruvyl-6-hydroxy-3-cyclohexene-1-carboxylate synthase / 2-succinyl-6-hydroxy-2,4-cyclohexadiene-1-carboxylate synthase / o-succinylbenzoate synthase
MQVKIFGGYTRFAADLAPPSGDTPARVLLTTLDTAFGAATNPAAAGPVHVNCQFREPLGPAAAPWPQEVLRVNACAEILR